MTPALDKIEELHEMLTALADYEPPEVIKDDFAYDRLLNNAHEFAREALKLIPELRREREWEDKPTLYQEHIEDAHPTKTGNHTLYQLAMELVSERHSKYNLVDLVNWLLTQPTCDFSPANPTKAGGRQ